MFPRAVVEEEAAANRRFRQWDACKIAPRQFTPPMIVLNNTNPKLPMESTLILSAEVSLPQANLAEVGDPFAGLGPRSNGPGSGAGIGNGDGTGVGAGEGIGLGPGEGGSTSSVVAGDGAPSAVQCCFSK